MDLNNFPYKLLPILKDNGKYVFIESFAPNESALDYHPAFGEIKEEEFDNVELLQPFFWNKVCFLISRGKKFGLMNFTGEIIAPVIYDKFTPLPYERIKFKKGRFWGIMDPEGNILVEPRHDYRVTLNDFSRFAKSDKVGLVSKNFNDLYGHHLSLVRIKGKKGFIDSKGREVVELKYSAAKDFSEGLASVKLKGLYGFINENGDTVIPHQFEYANSFKNGFASVKINGKWGVINKNGEIIAEPVYDEVTDFKNNLARVRKDGLWGFINRKGKLIVEPRFEDWQLIVDDTPDSSVFEGVSEKFHEVFYDFDSVGLPRNGLNKVTKDGKSGFINKNGERVVDLLFDEAREFFNGFAAVCIDNQWSFINTEGEYITDLKFDQVESFSENLAPVKKGKLWGLINYEGNLIFDFKYDDLRVLRSDLLGFEKEGKWGIMALNGNIIVEPQYDSIHLFLDNLTTVIIENCYGIIDDTGKQIVKPIYEYPFSVFSFKEEDIMAVRRKDKDKLVFLDKFGRELTEEYLLTMGRKI